jgi:ankyrin repeat protein
MVREALKSLPKSLHDSYDNAMKRIKEQNEEDQHIAHSALTWTVNAKRPLTVEELQVALAVEPGAQQLDDDNFLDIEIILGVCAGLVIVDEKLSVVRLVHYTTQEYFDGIQEQQFPDAQMEITCTLLTFLSFDRSLDMSWDYSNDLPPLVEYSQYCLGHAAGPPEHQLRSKILEFLGLASRWKEATKWRWRSPPWDFPDWPSKPSALWIAAAANLQDVTKFLLEEETTPPHLNGQEISVASYHGHLQIVQLLVEHGADVNTAGGIYGYPLQAASHGGHLVVVRSLIEHGADVNVQGGEYGNALQAASFNGHMDIVRLLIDHDANVNAPAGQFGNALQAASYNGHISIIQLLIEHGADVNAQGGLYNALQAASIHGHINIIQLLIEHDADVNAQGGEYGNALQAASTNGHINIVQLLIDHSTDVNAQGGDFENALQAASYWGHIDIVQLLIEYGADVNALGGDFEHALQAASLNGRRDIVQLLIDHNANVNVQGGSYGSALQAASFYGHIDIVQLLIDHNANVNVQGGSYGNALQAASFMGHIEIVQLLIEKGANVNALGGEYGSAIKAALYRGPGRKYQPIMVADTTLIQRLENIAQLLRDNGAHEEDPDVLLDNAVSEHDGQQSANGKDSFLRA